LIRKGRLQGCFAKRLKMKSDALDILDIERRVLRALGWGHRALTRIGRKAGRSKRLSPIVLYDPQGAGRGSSPCWTHTAVRLRPRRPTSAVMAVIMAGKRIPALPPSLSGVPGISNEELLCRQLEPLMRELLSQPVCLLGGNQRREAERHIPNLAREMCEVVVIARGAEVQRSKAGKASLAGVSGQLRCIARGADA
jgi:hypothetical protein